MIFGLWVSLYYLAGAMIWPAIVIILAMRVLRLDAEKKALERDRANAIEVIEFLHRREERFRDILRDEWIDRLEDKINGPQDRI